MRKGMKLTSRRLIRTRHNLEALRPPRVTETGTRVYDFREAARIVAHQMTDAAYQQALATAEQWEQAAQTYDKKYGLRKPGPLEVGNVTVRLDGDLFYITCTCGVKERRVPTMSIIEVTPDTCPRCTAQFPHLPKDTFLKECGAHNINPASGITWRVGRTEDKL